MSTSQLERRHALCLSRPETSERFSHGEPTFFVHKLVATCQACGCRLNNAFVQLSLLALVVIPELRMSDRDLVDVRTFEILPLFG